MRPSCEPEMASLRALPGAGQGGADIEKLKSEIKENVNPNNKFVSV